MDVWLLQNIRYMLWYVWYYWCLLQIILLKKCKRRRNYNPVPWVVMRSEPMKWLRDNQAHTRAGTEHHQGYQVWSPSLLDWLYSVYINSSSFENNISITRLLCLKRVSKFDKVQRRRRRLTLVRTETRPPMSSRQRRFSETFPLLQQFFWFEVLWRYDLVCALRFARAGVVQGNAISPEYACLWNGASQYFLSGTPSECACIY